jgi:hypothetical protein
MSYESAAEPIKIGYLMDFLLSDDYPQDRRDNLTGHRCLRRTGGRRLPCHLRARHRRQRRSNTRSDRHQSVVRKLDSAGMDGCRPPRGEKARCRGRELAFGRPVR